MNKRPSSGGSGNRSIIPIFANKKRRIKQALYANPNISELNDENSNNFNHSTETRRYSFSQENTSEIHNKKPTFGDFKAPGKFGNSVGTGSCSQNRSQPPFQQQNGGTSRSFTAGFGRAQNTTTSNRQNINGFGRGQQTKQGFGGSNPVKEFKQPANLQAKEMLKTLPPPIPGRPLQRNAPVCLDSSNNKMLTKTNNYQRQDNSSSGKSYCTTSQSQQQIKSKQVNGMRDQFDKSLKVITTTVNNLKKWSDFRDQLATLFEVFGTVDSAMSTNTTGNGKNFMLKDSTGTTRCTFWEMDRSLPRLTRGQLHRCVGSLDRRSGVLNCVSIRPTHQDEHKVITASLASCEKAMQEYLATFREH